MAVALKTIGTRVLNQGSSGSTTTLTVPAADAGDIIIIALSVNDISGYSAPGYTSLGGVSNDASSGGSVFALWKYVESSQPAGPVTISHRLLYPGVRVEVQPLVYSGSADIAPSVVLSHSSGTPTGSTKPVPAFTQPGAWHSSINTVISSTAPTSTPFTHVGALTSTDQVLNGVSNSALRGAFSEVASAGGGHLEMNFGASTPGYSAIAILIPEPPPPSGEFDIALAFGPATATGSSPSKAGFGATFDFGPASVEGQAPESGGAFRTKFSFNPTVEGQTDVSGGFATNFTFIPTFEARGFVTVATLNNQTALVVPRNSGQVLRLNLADTTTVADQPVRVYGSGELQVGSGWWDDILIVNGNYTGPWFDGSHLPAGLDPDTHRVRWIGALNASTSLYETRTFSGNPAIIQKLQSGPWVGGMGHSGVRFEGVPTFIANTGVNGGQAGYAATFREVGSWDF